MVLGVLFEVWCGCIFARLTAGCSGMFGVMVRMVLGDGHGVMRDWRLVQVLFWGAW